MVNSLLSKFPQRKEELVWTKLFVSIDGKAQKNISINRCSKFKRHAETKPFRELLQQYLYHVCTELHISLMQSGKECNLAILLEQFKMVKSYLLVFRFSKDLYLIMTQKLTLRISCEILKISCFTSDLSHWHGLSESVEGRPTRYTLLFLVLFCGACMYKW